MFNISHSEDSICSAEQTSLLSFLWAIAFIIGTICGLITNCINLKILTHKQYPTTTLSIYLIVLCFTDMAALLINILLWEILVIAKWSKSIAFTNFWYKVMLVLYPMILIAVSTSGNASNETGQFLPASLSDNKNHQKRIEMRQHSTVLTIMFSYLVSSLPWSIAQLWLIYPGVNVDGFATIFPWLMEISGVFALVFHGAKIVIYYFRDENFRTLFPGFG
uniref:G-protein coupled receptors family 1 profile domain-containing protein n=1 Tax=Romanomermis culicivorax TaxID=13658 RepID=A0A915JKT7_ROMCU